LSLPVFGEGGLANRGRAAGTPMDESKNPTLPSPKTGRDALETLPLAGLLVISLEQAVAAPMCTTRLADAGARVIKIERPEGDFARGYDNLVHGESAYFVWLNRGKESVVLDLVQAADKALFEAMLSKADVFVQNLKPGAARLRPRPAAPRLSEARHLLGVGLWRERPLCAAQGL